MPPAVAVWYLRGVSDCPLLAWGLPLRSGRGGAVGVAAQLVVFLACGVYGGGGGEVQRGRVVSRRPAVDTSQARNANKAAALCGQVKDSLALVEFVFFKLFQSP